MRKARTVWLALLVMGACWSMRPCFAEAPAKGTISGRVLTSSGEPLRRATVVIEEVKYADGGSETVADATTVDNGEFCFSDLAPGRYRLEAEKVDMSRGGFLGPKHW